MSVSKWKYTEECDGEYCCGDCDLCDKEPEEESEDLTDEINELIGEGFVI